MRCSLFDIGCHAQNAAQGAAFQVQSAIWEWWAGVGFLNKALIVLGLWVLVLYLTRGILGILNRIGGWKVALGYVLATLGLVLYLFFRFQPKKPAAAGGGNDRGGFRVPPARRPRRKRRFDPDTARWVEE